jgi:substrate import-associated zinc metallohydrolase lipoprotein
MNKIYILLLSVVLVAAGSSCQKPKDDLSKPIDGLGGVIPERTALDTQIYNLYTKPYNIEVKYRWSAGEMSLSTVVPAEESRVLPVMNILLQGWIAPFKKIVGEQFVKTYVPKKYDLIGSYVYLSNGNIVLGEASHGLAITIFGINQISLTNPDHIRRILGTIHHEVAHVLHQNKMYPGDFELVSVGDYQASWSSVATADANAMGFISSYGSSSPNEDFATLVASMLNNGKAEFDALVDAIVSEEGRKKIREKETIIINYFQQAYGIDFRVLQEETYKARLLLQGINQQIIDEATPVLAGKFIRLQQGNIQIPVAIDLTAKTASFTYIDANNAAQTTTSAFVYDSDGLVLSTPFTYDGKAISKIYWDSTTREFYIMNGTVRVNFYVSNEPTILPLVPAAHDLLYPGEYAILKTSPAALPQIGKFKAVLDEDIARTTAAARTYNYFYFNFEPAATDGTISLNVRTASGTYYVGIYYYRMVWVDKPNGTFRLEYVRANTSTASTLSYSQSLRNLLETHTFKLAYLAIPGPANAKIVGMVSVQEPDMFLYGAAGATLTGLP